MSVYLASAVLLMASLDSSRVRAVPEGPVLPVIVPADSLQPSRKNPSKALALSLLNTALPLGISYAVIDSRNGEQAAFGALLLGYGLVLGPAAGHLYAGNPKWPRNALIRTGAAAVSVTGAGIALSSFFDEGNETKGNLGALLFVVGGIVIVADALREIDDAPDAARRWNAEHGVASAQVIPLFDPVHKRAGLAVRVRL